MADTHGSPDTLEEHQHEVCNSFARAAAAMRDAAQTAEKFSNWFSRVNNIQNVPVPPVFGNGLYNNFVPSLQQQQQQFQGSEVDQTGNKRKDGKRKRQLKEKKPKDANAPKRPPSAYLLFQNEVRTAVKGEHPDMTYAQVLSEVSKIWHAMTPEEKAPYVRATADSKVLYEKAKADYEGHPTEATAKSAVPISKTPSAAPAVISKTPAQPAMSSDDSEETSEASSSEDASDEQDDSEPEPEPPRKKSKKIVKTPTPILTPAKLEKKKSGTSSKKKKAET